MKLYAGKVYRMDYQLADDYHGEDYNQYSSKQEEDMANRKPAAAPGGGVKIGRREIVSFEIGTPARPGYPAGTFGIELTIENGKISPIVGLKMNRQRYLDLSVDNVPDLATLFIDVKKYVDAVSAAYAGRDELPTKSEVA